MWGHPAAVQRGAHASPALAVTYENKPGALLPEFPVFPTEKNTTYDLRQRPVWPNVGH